MKQLVYVVLNSYFLKMTPLDIKIQHKSPHDIICSKLFKTYNTLTCVQLGLDQPRPIRSRILLCYVMLFIYRFIHRQLS